MKRFRTVLGLAALAIIAYLLFSPVPIEPVAWQAPRSEGYTGPYAPNQRLVAARPISVAPEIGPEHVEFGPDGKLYTGVLSGSILRMNPDGTGVETVLNTGGRPLGLAFDADGRLVIADAMKGLLLAGADGSVTVLTDRVGTEPIAFADAVVVAADGRIYFTDATQRFPAQAIGTFDSSVLDTLEHSCTGRVLVYDPATRQTRVVIGGMCFPNGVALSGDQSGLFVAETEEYRIWKVDVNAAGLDARAVARDPAHPQARIILANLPGFPDNLTRSETGRLWTGFTKPRAAPIDRMAGYPWLRTVTLRLPKALWPVPPNYGHVIAFDEDGRVVADLQDPSGRGPDTTGVTEHDGDLYVHTLHGQSVGVLPAGSTGR